MISSIEKAGTAAQVLRLGASQQLDQRLCLRAVRGGGSESGRVHGLELAALWKRPGQFDTLGADDLGRLRAADRPCCTGCSEFAHRGRAIRVDFQPCSYLVCDAKLLKHLRDMDSRGRCSCIGNVDRIRCKQRPALVIEAGSTSFSSASRAMSAVVRMMMSAGSPWRSLSAMPPTAPNSPVRLKPVVDLRAGARCVTRPCAAPPLRILRLFTWRDPLPRSGCRV